MKKRLIGLLLGLSVLFAVPTCTIQAIEPCQTDIAEQVGETSTLRWVLPVILFVPFFVWPVIRGTGTWIQNRIDASIRVTAQDAVGDIIADTAKKVVQDVSNGIGQQAGETCLAVDAMKDSISNKVSNAVEKVRLESFAKLYLAIKDLFMLKKDTQE